MRKAPQRDDPAKSRMGRQRIPKETVAKLLIQAFENAREQHGKGVE